MNYLEMDLQLA